MKLDVSDGAVQSLLADPSPATLTLYRGNGEAITSPVWFRVEGDAFEVVVAASDHKLDHLRRDARCVLLIFEAKPPFRGVIVRSGAELVFDKGAEARRAIASRYLGREAGTAYADMDRRPPGWIVRLPMAASRAWDLGDKLPD